MMHRLILILAICATPAFAKDPKPAPVDAEPKWTILCGVFTGPNHAANARAAKDYVAKLNGMKGFYLIQAADRTELNFGQYPDVTEQAKADRKAIDALVNPANGEKLFRAVLIQPIEGDDPVAPKEWDLKNAQGYWSLQVASYRDDPKRKHAAVELVKKYRQDGYEAYYHHGPLISSVCIGAFPVNAVKFQESEIKRDERTGRDFVRLLDPNEVKAGDPDEAVMVVPPGMALPEGQLMTPDGKRLKAVQDKREIVDPRLLALKKQFPHNADNDQVGKRVIVNGQARDVFNPSLLVVVPGQKELRQAQAAAGQGRSPAEEPGRATTVVGPSGLVRVPGGDNAAQALPVEQRNVGATADAAPPPEGPANPQPATSAPPKIKPPVQKPQGGKLKTID